MPIFKSVKSLKDLCVITVMYVVQNLDTKAERKARQHNKLVVRDEAAPNNQHLLLMSSFHQLRNLSLLTFLLHFDHKGLCNLYPSQQHRFWPPSFMQPF